MLLELTEGAARTIEVENGKLSQALERNFSNATLHERAAVLMGVFILQENSGDFYEIKSPLCRLTAHLAMARYLAGKNPPGINGRIGEAMVLVLMKNQRTALEKLSGLLEARDASVTNWVRVLRAHTTEDYRELAAAKKLLPIERVAWFRAFSTSVDTDIAWWKLEDEERKTADFCRIANQESYGVEVGHQLLAYSMLAELREIATIWPWPGSQRGARNGSDCLERQSLSADQGQPAGASVWGELWRLSAASQVSLPAIPVS